MPVYLDTRGHSSLGIAVCARCGIKMPRDQLHPDPNSPGLMVCDDDKDQLDPYRLPARETENITMEWTRPDLPLSPGPMVVPINPLQAVLGANGIAVSTGQSGQVIAIAPPVTPINPSTVWTANTDYGVGSQVTAFNPVGLAAAGLDIAVYLCVIPGRSGRTAPNWPSQISVEIMDGQVLWINEGLYLP